MKIIAKTIAAGLLVSTPLTFAHEGPEIVGFSMSANVSIVTDYLYRGLSQTTGDAAIQGGFDLEHESGMYLGVWASNVDFADSLEVDYYGGFAGSITEDISYDVGVIYYDYPSDPSDPEGDFLEVYGSVGYAGFTVGANYSDDFFAETGSALYYYGSYDMELPAEFSLGLLVAQQDFKDDTFGDEDSYMHYGATLGKTALGFDFALTWSDTDISKDECAAGGFGNNDCDSTVVFSISKAL